MRVAGKLASLLALLPLALTACGSSPSYQSEARAAVSTMRSAIVAYNNARSTGVAGTAAACARAREQIGGQTILASPPGGAPNRALASALRAAYLLAIAGFTDCAHAAPYGYLRMVRAGQEIQQADAWLGRARTLDH